MRELAYLSPSGMKTFLEDPEEFYNRYLCDNRIPDQPQTRPMSIGSAFDAYVKSWLHEQLFGKIDPKYELKTIFEAQVEAHNRDWAWQHGQYVFDCYQQSGALADLLIELRKANGEPRFEFEVKGAIHGYREGVTSKLHNVTLLGRPDVAYINAEGHQVVLDWKVNGYCSKYPPSPLKGYLRLRAPGRSNLGSHKECMPMIVNGLMINASHYLEVLNEEWATQLTVYHWLLGSPFSSETLLVGIDQIVCDATKGALPQIRIAEHRMRISKEWQQRVFDIAAHIWEVAHSDHFFRDMTREQSQSRCKILDAKKEALEGDGSLNDQWLTGISRGTQ